MAGKKKGFATTRIKCEAQGTLRYGTDGYRVEGRVKQTVLTNGTLKPVNELRALTSVAVDGVPEEVCRNVPAGALVTYTEDYTAEKLGQISKYEKSFSLVVNE